MCKHFITALILVTVVIHVNGQHYYPALHWNPSGVSFDADYQAVLDYADTQSITLPSAANQVCQNALVVDLKNDGFWSQLDLLYLFAGAGNEDFADINFEDPGNHTAVENGTVNYSTLDGYEKNATNNSDYIDTNWDMSNDCVNCSQNDIAMGGWFILNTAVPLNGQFYYLFGSSQSGQGVVYSHRNAGTVGVWFATNSTLAFSSANTGASLTGDAISVFRTNSTNMYFQEGTDAEDNTAALSSTMTSEDMIILSYDAGAANQNGFGGWECSIFYVSENLSSLSDYDDLHTHFETYMNCIE